MKLITKDSDYALRALRYIVRSKSDRISASELAQVLGIPHPFLRGLMQRLVKKGLVGSYRGKGGGFSLTIPPEQLMITDVLEVFQGSFSLTNCVIHDSVCPEIRTCVIHRTTKRIESYAFNLIKNISIGTIVNEERAYELEPIITKEMKTYFNTDSRRITHALNVLAYAREIMDNEGGNPQVIIASALLHDIGIKECERKYNSTNGQLQEKEGPPIAREILQRIGMNESYTNEVCDIIASHHSPGEITTLNFNILWDADCLVNYGDELRALPMNDRYKRIQHIFQTKTGRDIAGRI